MENYNILKKLSKPLNIEEVDFRIQSINKGGYATILAYKDARVDMNRLDEVCGVNWQDDYKLIDGQLFCGIAIKIDNDWIWRWDVGSESFTEKVKGRASDAFKRAGFRWGIGRELYDYPTIQVKLNENEFKVDNGKVKQTWNLKLKQWKWKAEFEDNKIVSLSAFDEKNTQRFSFNIRKPALTQTQFEATKKGTVSQINNVLEKYRMADTERKELNTLLEKLKKVA